MATDKKATDKKQYTDDGHFIVIKGRRWRATDPHLPADVEKRLTHHLMAGRRAVAAAGEDEEARKAARARVQLAKTGLGERGTAWWEQTPAERRERWEDCLRRLEADGDS